MENQKGNTKGYCVARPRVPNRMIMTSPNTKTLQFPPSLLTTNPTPTRPSSIIHQKTRTEFPNSQLRCSMLYHMKKKSQKKEQEKTRSPATKERLEDSDTRKNVMRPTKNPTMGRMVWSHGSAWLVLIAGLRLTHTGCWSGPQCEWPGEPLRGMGALRPGIGGVT